MDFYIPDYINTILNKLEEAGHKSYIVGGSVRDLILGKTPHDYDITTSAVPDEIQRIFNDFKTLLIGKQFGTVVVVQGENNAEVTTFRFEGKYLDGRRPSEVFFSNDIYEDLSRRDFTINAIAYNKKEGTIDPFNGQKDIEDRIIRCVGDPLERFREDHLRILRAVRFSTQLGFEIHEDTYNACKDLSSSLNGISAERIREELFKILLSENPSNGIKLMKDLNILEIVIPELIDAIGFDQKNPNHNKDVFEHIMCVLDKTPPILSVRLAALFHDIGKPHTLTIDEKGVGHFYGHDKLGAKIAEKILLRLNSSRELIDKVTIMIKEHMSHHNNMKDRGLKRQISRVGKDDIFNLLELQKADRLCSSEDVDITFLFEREEEIRRILNSNEPYEKSHLKIDGNDIIDLGFEKGKIVGEILDYLLEKVMKNPELNEKEKLKDIVREKYKK